MKKKTVNSVLVSFDRTRGGLAPLAETGLSRAQVLRALAALAKKDDVLWPYCSERAHRYALRKLREYVNSSGAPESLYEEILIYEQYFSCYINDLENH